MKKKLLCIFLLSCLCHPRIKATTDFSIEDIRQTGLPVVLITTVGNEEPTCRFVTHPEGSMGESITDCTKVPCRIILIQQSDTLYDSGEYEKNNSGGTIRINGNTSAYWLNKPYKLKLEKKADLLLRGNDNIYKDKEWRLLKDATSLRTIIGLKMNELMGMAWTPAYRPCNVFINGDYRGCYLLIESVKRNKSCRLNVDKESGYIIERDAYWWNENTYFTTDFYNPRPDYRWTWKYPDEDDVTEEQAAYIQNYINETEKSIGNGNYEQFIDIESFAAWLLAHDMLGTKDAGGSNLYVTKYDNTSSSLLQMGNLWDFDTIFWLSKGAFTGFHNNSTNFYFPSLLKSSNKAFALAYKRKWEAVKNKVPASIIAFLKSYIESEEGKALQASRKYFERRWNCTLNTTEEDLEEAVDWFESHIPLLNQAIQDIDDGTTGIRSTMVVSDEKQPVYNLQGQRVRHPKRGIYVVNGRKRIFCY